MKSLENLMAFKSQTAKKCMAVIAAASLASFASVAVFAEAADAEKKTPEQVQHHKHHGDMDGKRGVHKYHGKDHMGAKLDLSDAQKETMKAARATNEASMKALHENLRTAHDALDEAVAANADDAMLNKLSTDLASFIAQRELLKAKGRRDFLNLLTPEQKQKLAAFEAEHKNAPRWKNKTELKDNAESKEKTESKSN
ncbi:MAG TPA: Spy/CpxP family protein refolding chaperone [Cellvibrio sp.]|nr:Spy/CpxP family protein refolding chaperone [Cellvibrio sp.]